ncbi:hypothetical protein Tco_0951975 [Tanacetum coccineum]|uniref:Uncharacterized protein n=1 Tax=Tanacetum coccineum TaxID=301880 RepID=A0ABQ5DVS5_9ASTR
MKLITGRLVNGSSCDGIDMVIKNLDLEPKDVIAEFCGPSRWKELSKESGSKILPCGDGSCWKAFKIMSSITAQQAKLDLELVPKEKRFDIGKCNGRLNPGKTQREPTF